MTYDEAFSMQTVLKKHNYASSIRTPLFLSDRIYDQNGHLLYNDYFLVVAVPAYNTHEYIHNDWEMQAFLDNYAKVGE